VSQIKWIVKDVANIMLISNMVGDLIIRKESLDELTNYGQIMDMDLVTNSPKNIAYLMLGSLKLDGARAFVSTNKVSYLKMLIRTYSFHFGHCFFV